MNRNQRSSEELSDAQRMMDSDIQTCLLRIVDGTNKSHPTLDSRTQMENPGPWGETARGLEPQKPAGILMKMIRDATRTARKNVSKERQELMREHVHAFFATCERYCLEELDSGEESDVIALLIQETKVVAQGDEAGDLAKLQQTPENFLRVGEAMERQASVSNRLKEACFRAARAKFYTPRSVALFKGAR